MQYPRQGFILGLQRALGGGVVSRMIGVLPSSVRRGPYSKTFTKNTSVPDGYGMRAVVPPYNEDNLSSYTQVRNTGAVTAPLVTARNMAASFTNPGGITTANMGAIVQLACNILVTCSMTASLKATLAMAANLAQQGQITASLSVVAFCVCEMTNPATMTPNLRGTSDIAANMTSEGTAVTANACAAAVWSALASAFNVDGTMGKKLNDAGAASNPWETEEGQAVITQLAELWRIHGLKAGEPMTVTPTSRVAGDIEQTLSGDGVNTTTVERV